ARATATARRRRSRRRRRWRRSPRALAIRSRACRRVPRGSPDRRALAAGAAQALLAELRERPIRLVQAVQAHAAKDIWRLRELDVAVVHDLDVVAPGVEEVEPAARLDLDAGGYERLARRLFVVDDEAEVACVVGGLRPAFRKRDELVAHVDEGHAPRAATQLEVEDPTVELERVVDALDLERNVVDADEPWHGTSLASELWRRWLNPALPWLGRRSSRGQSLDQPSLGTVPEGGCP